MSANVLACLLWLIYAHCCQVAVLYKLMRISMINSMGLVNVNGSSDLFEFEVILCCGEFCVTSMTKLCFLKTTDYKDNVWPV